MVTTSSKARAGGAVLVAMFLWSGVQLLRKGPDPKTTAFLERTRPAS